MNLNKSCIEISMAARSAEGFPKMNLNKSCIEIYVLILT